MRAQNKVTYKYQDEISKTMSSLGSTTNKLLNMYLVSVSSFARLKKTRKKLCTFFDVAIHSLNCD